MGQGAGRIRTGSGSWKDLDMRVRELEEWGGGGHFDRWIEARRLSGR